MRGIEEDKVKCEEKGITGEGEVKRVGREGCGGEVKEKAGGNTRERIEREREREEEGQQETGSGQQEYFPFSTNLHKGETKEKLKWTLKIEKVRAFCRLLLRIIPLVNVFSSRTARSDLGNQVITCIPTILLLIECSRKENQGLYGNANA